MDTSVYVEKRRDGRYQVILELGESEYFLGSYEKEEEAQRVGDMVESREKSLKKKR